MSILEQLADKLKRARAKGIETGKEQDRLKGGRLWTEFRDAAEAQGMDDVTAERYLRDRKAG
jgi:hypothetical protein